MLVVSLLGCTLNTQKEESNDIFEGDEGQIGGGQPTNFNELVAFQIRDINRIGNVEGLVYDNIKASQYNNAVLELETLLYGFVKKDKTYQGELDSEKKAEIDVLQSSKSRMPEIIVSLSRTKFRCLVLLMSRHNVFPGQRISIDV